jgi:uncharacterized protein YjbI with pentapeptide repeats
MANNYTGQDLRGYDFSERDLTGEDFSGRDLTGADFTNAILEYANFTDAILENANFTRTNFIRPILRGANLRGVNLRRPILRGANLRGANLREANLSGANLHAADLRGAHLEGADLSDAHLERANLEGAFLIGAILEHSDLEAAILSGADLTGANLEAAYLTGADLTGADFTEAELSGAILENASLILAHFERVDLSYVTWERANLLGATFNDAYFIDEYGTRRGITMNNLYGAENVGTIILTERVPVPPVRRVGVNAHQVHQYFGKIKVRKLIGYIKKETDKYRVPPYVPGDVKAEFVSRCLHEIALRVDGQEIQDGKIDIIMEGRLNRVQYGDFDSDTLELVYYALEFAKLQPPIFREMYIKSYTDDVTGAYNGPDGMSCAAGAIERIVTSLVTGALTVADNAEEFKKYEEIVRIINVGPINDYVLEWYKLHNKDKEGETAWHAANNEEAKKESLKEYLTSLDLFNEEQIEKATDMGGYDEDDFIYKGGMRRRRTRRIIRKRSKGRVTRRRKEKVTRRRIRKGRKGRKSMRK